MASSHFDLLVVKIEDDGKVWITQESQTKLEEIELAAARVGTSNLQSHIPPKRGEVCVLHYNGSWKRGQVKRLYTSSKYRTIAEVFVMDHGIVISVPLNDLISANDMPISLEPPLIKSYTLSPLLGTPSLPSSVNMCWSDAVKNLMKNIVGGVNCTLGIPFKGDIKNDGSIELFHIKPNEKIVNINEKIITAGLLKVEEEEREIAEVTVEEKEREIVEVTVEEEETMGMMIEEEGETELSVQECKEPIFSKLTNRSTEHNKYIQTLKKLLAPHPKPSSGVFIEGTCNHTPWMTLEDTPFNPSVCTALIKRGFKLPTSVQANGWPHIWEGRNTILLSPHLSGKTLTYLLPLLCVTTSDEKMEIEKEEKHTHEPKIIVLVSGSYKAWNINNQATTILSWINAAKRFRSCALYTTAESTALPQILNGVDIVVATPSSLVQMMEKKILTLQKTKHLVLDDLSALLTSFSPQIHHIMKTYASIVSYRNRTSVTHGWHIVVCASSYSAVHWEKLKQYMSNPVTVVTNTLELIVMKKIKMHILTCNESQLLNKTLSLVKNTPCDYNIVICVKDNDEAKTILQYFSMHCLTVSLWHKGPNPPINGISIVSDDKLTELLESNQQIFHFLINYSLYGITKATFRRRLSLLVPSIYAHLHPSIILLLTSNCQEQSREILSLVERLQQVPPPELVSMATERQLEQKKQNRLRSLCLHLKSFGECLRKDCTQVHSLTALREINREDIVPAEVPKDGVVKVYVECVSAPGHLWVRLIDHIPLFRGESPVRAPDILMTQLSMDLALFYSNPDHCLLHANPIIGDICGLKDTNGSYYRAQILDFSRPLGLFFHHKEQAKVRLVDVGEVVIVDVNQLLTLPASFLATPPLVIEVFFCGLLPPDADLNWTPPSIEVARHQLEGHTLSGGVALSLGGSLWLDPVEERMTLAGVGVNTAIERPQKQLLCWELAHNNPNHLKILKKVLNYENPRIQPIKLTDCNIVAPSDGCGLQVVVTAVESPNHFYVQFITAEIHIVAPSDGCGLQVVVTAVESPNHFYVQFITAETQLQEITDQLNFNENDLLFDSFRPKLHVGEVCAAKFSFDNRWYRACVMEERKEQESSDGGHLEYLCFCLDYGDLEWVTYKCVQHISRDLLELPFQALCCSLYDAKDKDFCDNIHEIMWDVTSNQTFLMEVVSLNPAFNSTPFPESICYSVKLVTEDQDDLLTLLTNQNHSTSNNEPSVSDFTVVLNLILSDETMVSECLPFVLAKHGRVDIDEANCEQLTQIFTECDVDNEDYVNIVNSLYLISSTRESSAKLLASHGELCDVFIHLLKVSSSTNLQLSVIQLLNYLLLSTKNISTNFDMLSETICDIILISSGSLFACSIDLIASLIEMEALPPSSKNIQLLLTCLNKQLKYSTCVKFVCSLLHSMEGCHMIIPYLPSLLSAYKSYAIELREQLILSLLISTNHLSQSLYSHFLKLKNIVTSPVETSALDYILSSLLPSFPSNPSSGIEDEDQVHIDLTRTVFSDYVFGANDHVSASLTDTKDSGLGMEICKDSCLGTKVSKNSSLGMEVSRDSSLEVEVYKDPSSEMEALMCQESQWLTPRVLWSQSRHQIRLSVQVRGCDYYHIDSKGLNIAVWCAVDGKIYQFKLELFGEIDTCDVIVGGGDVVIKLQKVHEAFWPRLSQSKTRPPFVTVDHEHWQESSDEGSMTENEKKSIPWTDLHKRRQHHCSESYEGSNEDVREDEDDIEDNMIDLLLD